MLIGMIVGAGGAVGIKKFRTIAVYLLKDENCRNLRHHVFIFDTVFSSFRSCDCYFTIINNISDP